MFSIFLIILIKINFYYAQFLSKTIALERNYCSEKGKVEINNAVYDPGLGFLIFYQDLIFSIRAPKSLQNYPHLVAVNKFNYSNQKFYPFDAIVNVDDKGTLVHYKWHRWYAVKLRFPIDRSEYWQFDSFYSEPKKFNVSENGKLLFLRIPDGTTKILDAMRLPTSQDYYSGLFFVSGNIELHNSALEIGSDNRWNAIDIFANNSEGEAFGYRSYGTFFRYFHSSTSKPSIVGNSPLFENQVLIGCPMSLCFYADFDAATRTNDGVIHMFFDLYWYRLSGINQHWNYLSAKHINTFPVLSLKEKIRSGKNVWVSQYNNSNFEQFKLYAKEDILPNLDEKLLTVEFDAMFIKPAANNLYIFKDENYYVYDFKAKQLLHDYTNGFENSSYLRSVIDFHNLPNRIDSAFALNDQIVYFFRGSFMYKAKYWEKETGKPLDPVDISLIQKDLINCENFNYSATEYKTFHNFSLILNKYIPHKLKLKQNSNAFYKISFALVDILFSM
ncbi:hypothetical protein B4U79_18622 [Dinothrombium tinctorium]|uniref:Uncharacterized protein n=1 Tax=Dinothrombium tinctorium TaxID=1965070 RepID=A0A443QCV3_9ACAR|nr:hypothetical protein B4U79_18622 [Dinothrombium tinctorium]